MLNSEIARLRAEHTDSFNAFFRAHPETEHLISVIEAHQDAESDDERDARSIDVRHRLLQGTDPLKDGAGRDVETNGMVADLVCSLRTSCSDEAPDSSIRPRSWARSISCRRLIEPLAARQPRSADSSASIVHIVATSANSYRKYDCTNTARATRR